MRRNWLPWLVIPIVVAPFAWLLFAGLGRDPREIPSPLVGKPMPAFAGSTLEGGLFSSTELAGRPAVINFWASYCIPSCVEEHPVLLDLAARRGGQVRLVGVLFQDTRDGALGFLARYGQVSWPNLLNADGRISIDYGVTGPPETFFVDAKGIVVAHHIGPLTPAIVSEELTALGITP